MPDVVLNTYNLEQYAQRLGTVNSRIVKLDWRIKSLYSQVGLLALFNLIRADALTGFSWRIQRCQTYLNQCASDYKTIENELASYNPLNFTASLGDKAVTTETTSSDGDSEKEHSWFAKFVNNQLKASGSVLSGEISGEGEFLGASTSGSVNGSILYGEASIKNKMSWKFKDKDGKWDYKSFGLSTEAKATGALAKGTAEGNWGYLHGKVEGSALTGSVSGEAKATLWDDGKFNPSLFIGAKAEGSVLQGKAEAGFGNDQYGVYVKADGDLLHAEAEAKAGVGYIGADKNGNAQYGAAAKVSAMASVAQGKVKGGITIFGIDIDVGVKGYAGAAGVEAGATVTTNGVTGNFSGALGLGAGLDISVDWSDAEWIGDTIDAVGDFAGGIAETVGDFVGGTVSYISDVGSSVGDFLFGWW